MKPHHRHHEVLVRKDGSRIPTEIRTTVVVPEDGAPDTVVFPGIAQDGRISRRIARTGPHGIAVANALPYWHVPAERASIEAIATEYPNAVMAAVSEYFGAADARHAVAESQAAACVVLAEASQPEVYRNIALVRPVGFNAEYLTDENGEIDIRAFVMRSLRMLVHLDQSPLSSPWNLYSGYRIARRLNRRTGTQLRIALETDVSELAVERAEVRAAEDKLTAVFGGELDAMFPDKELSRRIWSLQSRLGLTALEYYTLPLASHSSMATPAGISDLEVAVSYVREEVGEEVAHGSYPLPNV